MEAYHADLNKIFPICTGSIYSPGKLTNDKLLCEQIELQKMNVQMVQMKPYLWHGRSQNLRTFQE